MTGSTSTSIWSNYQNGVRNYCGHELADGMVKNQKLPTNLLTPTTKEEEHDRPISMKEIVDEQWMTPDDLEVCAEAALKVFALGQKIAAEHGLILVDTKYEFGRDEETGEILLIDEVHTPDSSRYWLASTYQQKVALGQEPDNIDKEFLRLWFRENCDPYNDEVLPEAPRDLVLELARRYITLYEMITWKDFPLMELLGGESSLKEAMDSLLQESQS
jgi:phosphoribosylaminoimidazole-succinocarboxamide synthase